MSSGHVTVGHPVDVGSGGVFTISHDFELRGTLWLTWSRYYSTFSTVNLWLGRGWTVPYFIRLDRVDSGYQLTNEEGAKVLFSSPPGPLPVGEVVRNPGANMELRREKNRFTVLHWHDGGDAIERFCFETTRDERMLLAWRENLAGHRVVVEYDASGRPVRIIQELEQRVVELIYNKFDLISSIRFVGDKGPSRLLVQYEYDSDRRLVKATDAMGNQTTYEYDSQHRIISEASPLGATFIFRYDQQGRCNYSSGDGRFMERSLRYYTAPHMTRVTDSLGNTSEYYLNAAGQVMQEVSPVGSVTTREYDEYGRLSKVVHADGGIERFAYDDRGNRTALVDQCEGEISIKFNEFHLPIELVDPMGSKWNFEYDERGNFLALTNPLGHRWSYLLNNRNLVAQAQTPGGLIISHRYEPRLRWQESRDQISFIQRIEYDEFGNVTAIYDAQGLFERIGFDDLSRVIEVEDATGNIVRFRWNAVGQKVEQTGPGNELQRWEYDIFGQLVAHTNPLGSRMRMEYDTEGRLTLVVNRAGERFELRYDSGGNVVDEKLFDGRVQHYEYDVCGRRVRIMKSDSRTVTQQFDKCDRWLARQSSDGLHEEFVYDKRGDLIRTQNRDAVVELERNALGRVVAEVQNGLRIQYEYDADNNRTQRRLQNVNGGVLRMSFDIRGRLVALADSQGLCQEVRWDDLDRLIERRLPGGVVEQFSYNRGGRLQEQRVSTAGAGILRRYAYDERENLSSSEDQRRGTARYKYDLINRLTEVIRSGRTSEYYRYDAIGTALETHRGRRIVSGGGVTLDDGTRQYTYDMDGCVAKIESGDAGLELKYDVDGKLVEALRSDGTKIRYTYDPLGRRTSKQVGGERTEFLWEGCEPAGEIKDGKVSDTFFFIDREPMAQWRGLGRLTPITNRTGAVHEVLSDRGDVLWEGTLDSYGNLLSESGSLASHFRFRGQYHDGETGFHYNFYRTYDPLLSDFLSPDPIGIEGGSHFYIYPRNPLSWDDPFGLRCTNKHKGKMGESRMDKHYRDRGYKPMHLKDRPRGIDGVYYKKGGKPPYIIVEAKYGSSDLKRTNDGSRQLSDAWIDSPIAGSGSDRLTAAVGGPAADRIRTASENGNVGKDVFRAPEGSPGYSQPAGGYNANSGEPDVDL